jgi:2,4-dienoyl-CoA reductase (NADPH2)
MVPASIFEPFDLAGLALKNRIVALPIFTGYAKRDGTISSMLIEHYRKLAESGPAMIVVANIAVDETGLSSHHQLRADNDRFLSGLSRLAGVIKESGAIVVAQLNHAGRFAKGGQPLLPSPFSSEHLGFNLANLKNFMEAFPFEERFGLTQQVLKMASKWDRAMRQVDREGVAADFAAAAARAVKCGFDGVELHGASGYLLNQSLSAFTNQADPPWGGAPANRARFPLNVLSAVKAAVPAGFPVGWRLLTREWVPKGIDLEEATRFAELLQRAGAAYVSLSAGTHYSFFLPEVRRKMAKTAYLLEDGLHLKKEIPLPVVNGGRVLTADAAVKMLSSGAADLVGLGRSLRVDASWIAKAALQQRAKACINCWWCFKRVILEKGFNCAVWPDTVRHGVDLEHRLLTGGLFKGLWVLASAQDHPILRAGLNRFIPATHDLGDTVLFLKGDLNVNLFSEEDYRFLAWARGMWNGRNFDKEPLRHVVRYTAANPEDTVIAEIEDGGYGAVLLARNPVETWRSRLVYKLTGKIIGLLGDGPNQNSILVAIDLSDVGAVVLRCLKHFTEGKSGLQIQLIHILDSVDPEVRRHAEEHWKRIREIAGWQGPAPYFHHPVDNVAGAIIEFAEQGRFGCLVLGKRGLGGWKRWWLGSVSSQVVKGLTAGQSLFVVD